jgi:hypothetical protein
MKTLKKSMGQETKYLRVSDGEANGYVRQGYSYCPRSEWKTNVRDFGKERSEETEKSTKKKSKKNS